MQTFLPYADFDKSADVLDRQRLGKQRVEVWQLLKALSGETKGWVNHPATRMWRGYEPALAAYGVAVCRKWIARGYNDTLLDRINQYTTSDVPTLPAWFGSQEFHESHKSNLKRKLPEHYGALWPDVPDDLPYIWPEGKVNERRLHEASQGTSQGSREAGLYREAG